MRTPANANAKPTSKEQAFLEWLDQDFEGHVAVKYENGQWFALLMEFDITGCGESKGAAVVQSLNLLSSYLLAYYEDGASFADVVRPIPRRLRVRIGIEGMLGHTLRRLRPQLSLARESTYDLPPGVIYRYAH
ncbi:MAG TPA: hypothetical protein VES65_09700 [Solirubrobacteraceae bacterium]|nr:hypothetical protein [Solirubrobacteraceae bacterium]